jgi:aconitate hydratase
MCNIFSAFPHLSVFKTCTRLYSVARPKGCVPSVSSLALTPQSTARAFSASSSASGKVPFSKFDQDNFVDDTYNKIENNLTVVRRRLNRPLSLSEKILYGHLADANTQEIVRGKSFLLLNPDRVAMQGTAPIDRYLTVRRYRTNGHAPVHFFWYS